MSHPPSFSLAPPASTQYRHSDGLGSIIAATNLIGTLAGATRYDAWGNLLTKTGTLPR